MSVKNIVQIGEKILRKNCNRITSFNTNELKELERDLKDTLVDFREKYTYGRGISAPQIRILKQAIYIITEDFEGILINPMITFKSKKVFFVWDSCFSANIDFFIKILRHYKIEVEYLDILGNKKILKAEGNLSELLQHEIDHLSGILFIDYLDQNKRNLITKEVYEKIK